MKNLITILISFFAIYVDAQNPFKLLSIEPVPKSEIDSLKIEYPWLDSLIFYDITFSTLGHRLTGYYIIPKKGNNFPCIVYNVGGNIFGMHFDHAWCSRVMAKYASSGYAMIAYNYLDQKNQDILEGFGGKDVDVIVELINNLFNFPEIDTSKIGVMGWSRGGLEVYQLLPKTNKLKAAVVGGAIACIEDMASERPVMDSVFALYVGDTYWSNKKDFYDARNAKTNIRLFPKNVPILLLHGNSDWRVNTQQSLDMARLFNENKIPYRLIIYEGSDHGITEHLAERDLEIIKWFDRFLKNGEALPDMLLHGK